MKTFIYAYLGGLLASIPAFTMFNDVGASPLRNYQALDAQIGTSLTAIIVALATFFLLPAIGSAIGAKIGGRGADFHYIYGRGIGGQVVFAIAFELLVMSNPSVSRHVLPLPIPMQTVVYLMFAQLGCTFGTVWGY